MAKRTAMMAVEIMVARQLTYFSAWEKDHGHRCDLEAGMAKLLGARVAWAAALLLVALMVAAGLYDRAVLMPSLEAAFKRSEHGAADPKFERDRAFLWRMSAWTHALTFVGVLAAAACIVFA